MPAPSTIRCYVTEEGREIIINALDNNSNGQDINTICTARLANNGDESTVIKTYTTVDFQTAWTGTPGFTHATIGNTGGYMNISKYKVNSSPYNTIKFYICIPPADSSAFTCNELMIYADPNPLVESGETGFIYATFPAVTKTDTDGLQFEITLEL